MKRVCLLALVLVACGGGSDRTPEQVAEAYLRAGSAQNEADVRASLDPACHANEGMLRVDSVRMMGAPITIEELTVTATETGEESATVRYEVAGPAHGSGGTQQILGVTVTTGEVNIAHAEQSGTLSLRKVDGEWRVACP
ncbi:MAG: hypothetical protein KC619_11235 [Myxococcales bacterium]|nr:hypothetical protein [Myxococcales bacterium]